MDLFDKKSKLIDDAELLFKESLVGVDQQLAKEILKIYAKFVIGKDLVLNADELAKLEDTIIAALLKTDYKLAVKAYIPNFDALKLLDKAIQKELNDIDIQKVLDENLKIRNFQNIIESQLKGTPSTIIEVLNGKTKVIEKIPIRNASLNQLIDPILDMVRTDIITGITYESAAEQMLDAIKTNKLGLEQWAGQISKDALNQSSGITNDEVRKEFDMEWIVYGGTIKKTTRPICYHLIKQGSVFKFDDLQKELDSFIPNGIPSESTTSDTPNGKPQKKGAGMIVGTDAQNFMIRRGGYNCGHWATSSTKPPPGYKAKKSE